MPWLETNPMDQRLRFLEDVRLDRLSMTERCAHYQSSRKTGYKWIDREAEVPEPPNPHAEPMYGVPGSTRGPPERIRDVPDTTRSPTPTLEADS